LHRRRFFLGLGIAVVLAVFALATSMVLSRPPATAMEQNPVHTGLAPPAAINLDKDGTTAAAATSQPLVTVTFCSTSCTAVALPLPADWTGVVVFGISSTARGVNTEGLAMNVDTTSFDINQQVGRTTITTLSALRVLGGLSLTTRTAEAQLPKVQVGSASDSQGIGGAGLTTSQQAAVLDNDAAFNAASATVKGINSRDISNDPLAVLRGRDYTNANTAKDGDAGLLNGRSTGIATLLALGAFALIAIGGARAATRRR